AAERSGGQEGDDRGEEPVPEHRACLHRGEEPRKVPGDVEGDERQSGAGERPGRTGRTARSETQGRSENRGAAGPGELAVVAHRDAAHVRGEPHGARDRIVRERRQVQRADQQVDGGERADAPERGVDPVHGRPTGWRAVTYSPITAATHVSAAPQVDRAATERASPIGACRGSARPANDAATTNTRASAAQCSFRSNSCATCGALCSKSAKATRTRYAGYRVSPNSAWERKAAGAIQPNRRS